MLKRPRALRRLLWSPDELGLGRAWVSGDLDVEGDLYEAVNAVLDARAAGAHDDHSSHGDPCSSQSRRYWA